jgi:hypothetical protein
MEIATEEQVKINLLIGVVPARYCSFAQSQIDNEGLTIQTDHLFRLLETFSAVRKYKGQYMIYLSKKGRLNSIYYQLVLDYLKQYEMPFKEVKDIPLMNAKQFKQVTGIEKVLPKNEIEAAHLVLGKRG